MRQGTSNSADASDGMRIAVLNPTASGMSGGYRSYLRNILPRFAADERVEALLCCTLASLRAEEWIPRHEKMRFAACPPFSPLRPGLGGKLTGLLETFRPDILFVPTARAVRFGNVPVVTMVQNMAPLGPWKSYGPAEWPRLAVQWLETRRAVRRADGVVAISGFVREFLRDEWAVPEMKIASSYFGAPAPSAAQVRPARLPVDWSDFIFTAGSLEPYRCLEDLVACAEHSRTKRGRPLRIVLAGSARAAMKSYESRLKAMAEKRGVTSDLCWIGQLTSAEMSWCYANCAAFVMTSRIEACPNTALEALACGAICIVADNPPLPELFAEAALYYTPGSGEMLAARIGEIRSWSAARKTEASAAAVARSRRFSWETASRETLDFLERVSRSR